MRMLAGVMAAVVGAQMAGAVEIEHVMKGKEPPAPIVVRFSSFASGIDGAAYRALTAYAAASPLIARAVAARWGKEGEVDFGLHPKPGKADAVLAEVRALMPVKPAKGQVEVLDRR